MWYVVMHPKKAWVRTCFRDPQRATALRLEYKERYSACDQVIQVPDLAIL